jgi:2-methylcitrate dehydratase PrpD
MTPPPAEQHVGGEAISTSPVTTRLAAWVADLELDSVPAEVRERAKDVLLDGFGCALVGARLPWSRTATDAVLGIEGSGNAPVIGTGETTSAPGAAVLNGTSVQGFELDDFHPLAPLHSASVVIPALLSTTSQVGSVTGADALLAAVTGFETGPRVGKALHGAQMLSRGWHSGSVFGTHAAAMTAGKLRGLDAGQLEDALGLAGTQSSGLMAAQYEAMSKRMHHGFAARNGFYAAALAAAGYTGIKAVFDREYGGFLSVFGEGHDPQPDEIVKGLGESWEIPWIMLKSYAAMGGLHGAIDAALDLRAEPGFSAAAIARIDITVGRAVYHHGWWEPKRPLTAIGAQMNIGYATAAALVDGAVLMDQFSCERLDAGDLWALIERTQVHLDPALDDAPAHERFATHVALTMRDGARTERRVVMPHGNPLDPMTRDEAVAKFHALTDKVTTRSRANEVKRLVLDLDAIDSLDPLIDVLAPDTSCALG